MLEVSQRGEKMLKVVVNDVAWKKLWSTEVPPKVRTAVWQIAKGFTASKFELARRHVLFDSLCPRCQREEETACHIFFNCMQARHCWNLVSFKDQVERIGMEADSFTDWVLKLTHNLRVEDREIFMMMLWAIWRDRNEKLWKGGGAQPSTIIFLAASFLAQWKEARVSKEIGVVGRSRCMAWHPPRDGFVKLNLDTAFFQEDRRMGFGRTIFDDRGNHMLSYSTVVTGVFKPEVGEALNLLDALKWLKEFEITNVEIEMDAKVVVDAFYSAERDVSTFGDIITACKRESGNGFTMEVKWVRRETNFRADAIAKGARNFPNPFYWDELPNFVERLPNPSCSC